MSFQRPTNIDFYHQSLGAAVQFQCLAGGALLSLLSADEHPGWSNARVQRYYTERLTQSLTQCLSAIGANVALVDAVLQSTYILFFGDRALLTKRCTKATKGTARTAALAEVRAILAFRQYTQLSIPPLGWRVIRGALENVNKALDEARTSHEAAVELTPATADALTSLFAAREGEGEGEGDRM